VAFGAHSAETATYMRGNGDAVTLFDIHDGAADLFDDAERFVTDDPTFDSAHAAFVEVKIRTTDGGGREAEQDVRGLPHLGVLDFANYDLARLFKDDRSHM